MLGDDVVFVWMVLCCEWGCMIVGHVGLVAGRLRLAQVLGFGVPVTTQPLR